MARRSQGTISALVGILRQSWPLAEKELRVASRRRRTYTIRFLCTAVLAVLASVILAGNEDALSRPLETQMRSHLALTIVSGVVWFELIASQLLTMLVFSTSIGEEIQGRTLAALLTTPMTAVQVVLGKLMGRLPQILLLMILALPVLAVVRIFGGVAWTQLMGCFCILLCGAMATAAATMCSSTRHESVLTTCMEAAGLLFLVYLIVPGLVSLAVGFTHLANPVDVLAHSNPFVAVSMLLDQMANPIGRDRVCWWLACLVLLVEAGFMLLIAMGTVQTAMSNVFTPKPGRPPAKEAWDTPYTPRRRVGVGPLSTSWWADFPVAWREAQVNLPARRGVWLGNAIMIVLALIPYALMAGYQAWDFREGHAAIMGSYLLLLYMGLLIGASTSLAWERRMRSLPFLLMSMLTDGQILRQKVLGHLYCYRVFAYLLVGHCLVFTLVGVLPPQTLLVLPVGACMVAMAACIGLLCASLCRHTVGAVILALGLWFAQFVLLGILLGFGEELLFFIPAAMPSRITVMGESSGSWPLWLHAALVAGILLLVSSFCFAAAKRLMRRSGSL